MSGGVVGPIGMVGAVGVAAVGAAVVIGATAKAAVDITRMGSIAAYEQMKLAAACTAAVSDAKTLRKKAVETYQNESREVLSNVKNALHADILRLKSKLEQNGYHINLRELGSSESEILIKLISMDQVLENRNSRTRLRIPYEVYHSITALVDPLFAFIPDMDPVFRELTALKKQASAVVADENITATEKSRKLIEIESQLVARLEIYRACSRKYEYYLAQFTSLLFANHKLAEACGQAKIEVEYNPYEAQTQIDRLSRSNSELRKTLRSEMTKNKDFLAANKELCRLVFLSIKEAGYEMKGISEQDYGTSAMFSFRSSLLRVTVSKQGILSMDLVGRNGEKTEQIKADETVFCKTAIQDIHRSFEKNGLTMEIDRVCNLTADSVLYEDDVEIRSYQDDRWYDQNPHVLYATPAGEEV